MKEKNAEDLLSYINSNMGTYMKEYLRFSEYIVDEEIYAYELINNNDLNKAQVDTYIDKLKTILKDITKISNTEFWKVLIEKDKVEASENNLLEYFMHSDNQWTDELVSFVNNSESKVTVNLSSVIDQYGYINLFNSTVQQYDLNDTRYSNLITSMKSSYQGDLLGSQSFSLTDVPNSKISILINNRIIEMNTGTLKDIRSNYPDRVNDFI
ncbi:hypothetical protein FAE25_002793, partial [Enterococcus faecalis]|nr:hypothetical protein [Enterococcus faecalis]